MDIAEKIYDKKWYPKDDKEALALFRYLEYWFWEALRLERYGKRNTQEWLQKDNRVTEARDIFYTTMDKGTYVVFTSEKDPELESLYKYHKIKTGGNAISITEKDPDAFKFGGSMWAFKEEIATYAIPEDLVEFINSCREEKEPQFDLMTRQELLAYTKENKFPIDYIKLTDEELAEAVKTCYYAQYGTCYLEVKGVRYEELEMFSEDEEEIDLNQLDREGLIALCTRIGLELPVDCDYSDARLREEIMIFMEEEYDTYEDD